MDIINTSHVQSVQNIQGLHKASAGKGNAEPAAPTTTAQKDSVSFSEEALRLSDAVQTNAESPRIRFDLVNRIRAEIAAGTYDTPDKMDIALERMASRIF
jgi:flagellar biosynthesis anti-sigma factor FlgM